MVSVLLAASAPPSPFAPLTPILLIDRTRFARSCPCPQPNYALLPMSSAKCRAPAAMIPQLLSSRAVSMPLAASARPSTSAPLSPMADASKSVVG